MKLELKKREVMVVVNMRAWDSAFGKLRILAFTVFLGPVVFLVSTIGILLGWDDTIAGIFAGIGVIITAYIPTVIKKFKESKKEIINEVVKEEHSN